MDSKILGHLQRKINERIEDIIESIASGGSKDFAEYKEKCGVIRGLRLAHMEVSDLAGRLKESEDE